MNIHKELADFIVLGFFILLGIMAKKPLPEGWNGFLRIEKSNQRVMVCRSIAIPVRSKFGFAASGTCCFYTMLEESEHGIPDSIERSRKFVPRSFYFQKDN